MGCPDFEELLRQGTGGHAARCEECGALLEAWAFVDQRLEAEYGGIAAPADLPAAVRMRIARERAVRGPSPLPEVLDFIGWAAILALAAVLAPQIRSMFDALLSVLS